MSIAIIQVQADFYTHKQATLVLGVTRKTLWRWIRDGKIQGHNLGREVFIEKAEVERIKAEREVT